ncbi:hypothetical protein MB02_10535 [Croceicoccus estronivorus]|uniref:LysR family transcriptional regulator n=1 Tax=Croceicoccus estronivorus TaxID=1172626 RepID=UPI00082A327E|nr:LysR family transcriptional regulator [Croceicoccus estronivorus]OCC23601.1 hypothetical protein MB02_10535 [Croceicoccus estronivorus]
MEFSRLHHIVAVARTGSFSRAAEEVFLTQPALSRSIAAFEARHGVRLFERRRRGVVPTPAGRMVVERAQAIIASTRELEESLVSHAVGDAGEVVIGVGPLLASLILPLLGQRMLATRPTLKLRTTIKTRSALLTDLAEDKLELLLANSGEPDILIDFDVRGIANLPMSVVVRGGHPLAGRDGLTIADLAPWPAAAQVIHLPGLGGDSGVFACENHHVLRDVVLSSDSYTCTSRAFVAQELREGRLAELAIADFPVRDIEVGIVRRRNRRPSPAALAVEEEAVRLLRECGEAC